MKFRFEQKVIYRDLDPFVIISLWVFAVSPQFSYAIKWDHNICHGGRRGRRRLQRKGKLKEVWCSGEKDTRNSVHPSTGATALMESVVSSWEALFCFWTSLFNIHKYLSNRPHWFHMERWYQNKWAVSQRHCQHQKSKQQDLSINSGVLIHINMCISSLSE